MKRNWKAILKDDDAISDDDLEEIKNFSDGASPGPWVSYIEGRDHLSGSDFIMTGPESNRGEDIELSGATRADQDFIAHSRQDIPRLLDEITRLRKFVLRLIE